MLPLESPWQVRFNRVYFTIFRAKLWKGLIFEWIFLLEIQTNCRKLGLEGNIIRALNVCSHWDNSTGYTIEVPLPGRNIMGLGRPLCRYVDPLSR